MENNKTPLEIQKLLASLLQQVLFISATIFVTIIGLSVFYLLPENSFKTENQAITTEKTVFVTSNIAKEEQYWIAPKTEEITDEKLKTEVEYGKELIVHTAKYLGLKGSVMSVSNGTNCQNCHLEAGTKVFGNNFSSVASMYPQFRARSGKVESIEQRVNDCFERSVNGKKIDTTGREMQAIKAYITFLGKNVAKGQHAKGSGLKDLAYLDRPASVEKGKMVYEKKCQSCHQANGEGQLQAEGIEYLYPPLWGKNSYNDAAGIFRISNFAKFVKYNMPLGASHTSPLLTDEEAWDVAAFVNSQPRPHKDASKDWKDIKHKPIDYSFAPFADTFSTQQHKYGSFKEMIKN